MNAKSGKQPAAIRWNCARKRASEPFEDAMQGRSGIRGSSKWSTVILTLLALLAVITVACAQSSITVAAWNIAGVEPIPEERLNNIAAAIHHMAPDVLLLTEVNPPGAATRLAKKVTALGLPMRSAYVPAQDADVFQHIKIVHRPSVKASKAALLAGSDAIPSPGARKAVFANVKVGEFDFILVGVHLKSGRGDSERAMRTQQCSVIAQEIAQRTGGAEKDVLVVGDYNMIPGKDQVNFDALSPNGGLRFISSTLKGPTHLSGCNMFGNPRGNFLDGFAIATPHTSEYMSGSVRLFRHKDFDRTCDDYRQNVSDHFPIAARFVTASDDD
jgi:endonuclease/exonuclease/phosphatase family metal-dependent hydrolase